MVVTAYLNTNYIPGMPPTPNYTYPSLIIKPADYH